MSSRSPGSIPVSIIDVGSNSTNHLSLDADGNVTERRIVSTRLAQGLHQRGALSADGIARTVAAVRLHADTARSLGVERVRVVGTAACRRASNLAELSKAIVAETGLHLHVLSEDEEARASFAGALVGLDRTPAPTLVLDIGGGSTELAWGVEGPDVTASLPFGAVTATEAYFPTDPARPEDLTNLIGAVSDEIEDIVRRYPSVLAPARVVGVAGTIVTVAAVELGVPGFDAGRIHGMTLTRDAAEDVFRTVATESLPQRRLNPGLDEHRADIIVAGCCILVAVMRRLQLGEICVSVGGLLDGLALHERLSP